MKHKTLPLLLTAISLTALSLHGQLAITSVEQTTVINFQSDVGWTAPNDPIDGDDVFKWNNGTETGNGRDLIEDDGWGWGGSSDYGMSADAWSWRASGVSTGMGTNMYSQFGDYDNDGVLDEFLGSTPGLNFLQLSDDGIGAEGDYAYAIGRNGGNNAPWRSYDLVLRVQNQTAQTITDWAFSIDGWFADNDGANSDVSISWSTDMTNFNIIDSYTTTNNGGVYTEADMGGTFSASIAPDAYLYLQFSNQRVGGSGSGANTVVDNWTVTAIPEPSFYAASIGLLALGLGLLRRQRR